MSEMDHRLTPARADLAASFLKDRVTADRYVDPVDHYCVAPSAPIRRAASHQAGMDDQVLHGEIFAVLEEVEGWCWGFSRADGYVGWVEAAALSSQGIAPDHRITALRTYLFPEPDFKKPPLALLSLNARFAAGERDGKFLEARGQGWVTAEHCAPLATTTSDFVAVAEAHLGAPYLWGGKESLGLDCSGLVQMALAAAGIDVPRDADQQEAALKSIWDDVTEQSQHQRGDIVFWPGHVGILTDSEHLLHANAFTMDVTLEPFAEAEARIRASENPVRTIVRPPA